MACHRLWQRASTTSNDWQAMVPSNLLNRALLCFHFHSPRRSGVLSGGGMSGYGMMLGLCRFMLLVLSVLAFRGMLEIFLLFFLLCFVAHLPI